MTARTWLITGVSSGFGRELTRQLLTCGDRVIGTVRDTSKIADLTDRYLGRGLATRVCAST
jgi:short-subunit dehydrogenase involved in D-alanine esterification of teichoic acids